MSEMVVVDANVAMKRLIPEPLSNQARSLFLTWERDGARALAPAFFAAEVDSILRQKIMLRKELTASQAEAIWTELQRLPVVLVDMAPLRRRAWKIAQTLAQPHVYDAVYVALAESVGCDFWTADERLVAAAGNHFGFVRSLATVPEFPL